MNSERIDLSIDDIKEGAHPRRDAGDLGALGQSIGKLGLLHPLVVDRKNVLIAGGRRLAACRNIGLEQVPCIRLDVEAGNMAALEVQADENLCREPLSCEELERLIQVKKDMIAGKTSGRALGWLKHVFAKG